MLKNAYTIEYVRNPKWSSKEKSAIDCFVKLNHCKRELPFTANPNDCEVHGREIFQQCVNGEFGPIADFDDPPLQQDFIEPQLQQELPSRYITQLVGMLDEANAENSAGTARGIVLVWGAFLEVVLNDYIEGHYQNQNSSDIPAKKRKQMKSLGGKIVVADELGLLENDLHEDLKQIKELRNSAAHNLHFTKFSHLSKQEALAAYEHLYTKYASDDFHEVDDLLFVSRFVYGTACQMVLQKLAVLFDRLLRP